MPRAQAGAAPSPSFVAAISKDVDADLRRHDGIDHDPKHPAVGIIIRVHQ
jgi:hypothetical protein